MKNETIEELLTQRRYLCEHYINSLNYHRTENASAIQEAIDKLDITIINLNKIVQEKSE